MKKLLIILGFLALSQLGLAQSANTYDKKVVMESITDLNSHTIKWIESNFDRLSNDVVQNFMNRSTLNALMKKHPNVISQLKAKSSEEEIELFYKNPSEEALLSLMNKYGITE